LAYPPAFFLRLRFGKIGLGSASSREDAAKSVPDQCSLCHHTHTHAPRAEGNPSHFSNTSLLVLCAAYPYCFNSLLLPQKIGLSSTRGMSPQGNPHHIPPTDRRLRRASLDISREAQRVIHVACSSILATSMAQVNSIGRSGCRNGSSFLDFISVRHFAPVVNMHLCLLFAAVAKTDYSSCVMPDTCPVSLAARAVPNYTIDSVAHLIIQ
jgi:hypothetical protein